MPFLYQVGEELQEEGDDEQTDVHAVHIGIGSCDDFVVAQCLYAVFYIQGCLKQVEFFVFINYFLGQSVEFSGLPRRLNTAWVFTSRLW